MSKLVLSLHKTRLVRRVKLFHNEHQLQLMNFQESGVLNRSIHNIIEYLIYILK